MIQLVASKLPLVVSTRYTSAASATPWMMLASVRYADANIRAL
jgi:hypothetical protein